MDRLLNAAGPLAAFLLALQALTFLDEAAALLNAGAESLRHVMGVAIFDPTARSSALGRGGQLCSAARLALLDLQCVGML